jgi:hypothetical protein
MAERREPPEQPAPADDPHPVEPAEGTPDPGESPDQARTPHPDEPAEGEG